MGSLLRAWLDLERRFHPHVAADAPAVVDLFTGMASSRAALESVFPNPTIRRRSLSADYFETVTRSRQ